MTSIVLKLVYMDVTNKTLILTNSYYIILFTLHIYLLHIHYNIYIINRIKSTKILFKIKFTKNHLSTKIRVLTLFIKLSQATQPLTVTDEDHWWRHFLW